MKKYLVIFSLSLTVLLFFTLRTSQRFPAGEDQHNLEMTKIKLNERVSFVLLGVKDYFRPGNMMDLSKIDLEVEYQTSTSMVPKFLFSVLDGEVKEVYSFELKRKGTKTRIAQESTDEIRWYVKIDPDHKYLPKRLLDLDKVRKHTIINSTIKLALTGVLFTEFAPVGILLNRLFLNREEKRSYQASYLERLVRLELFEDKLPILKDVFTEEDLWNIGAGLNLRFNNQSLFGSYFVKKNKVVDLYRKYRKLKEEEYASTMGKLVQRTNEEGLLTIPLTSDFAMVYGFKNRDMYNQFSNFLVGVENPQKMIDILDRTELDLDGLIPLGIFSTRQSATPMTLVDFNNVGGNSAKSDLVKVAEDVKEIGFTFLSFSGLSIALDAVDGVFQFINMKSGSALFEYRAKSDAEFDLLVDTGILELSQQSILRAALNEQLARIDVSETEREEILSSLYSGDKIREEETINHVVRKFTEKEREEKIIDFGDHYEKAAYRIKNWYAFVNYLNTNEKIERFSEKLQRRNNQERTPASEKIEINQPVVILMVDGLRPDRLKRAAASGLMPNIKNDFINSGHEFNSFVSRSLTLPSWGTILTGHTPDQHGVRSNMPVRRDIVRPRSNYIDVRKDLHSIFTTGNNRSLNHLKESGVKWVGDYYDPSQTLMNYMPLSRGLNLPLKQLGMTIADRFDEFSYGAFGGALALDLASVARAEEKIKKNPGQYRLVMNWFASVDTASHNNNDSLDEIYQELDKSIGSLISTLKTDPVLKNAHIILVSDHGLRGGHEPKGSEFNLNGDEHHSDLNNTAFNLTTFFTGDYFSHSHYNFVVKTFESPHPDHDLSFLKEFQIHPFDYTYRGKKKNKGEPNIMVDYSGDALAQVYLKSASRGWEGRPSLYELQSYALGEQKVNLIEDLLNVRLISTDSSHRPTREKLYELTGNKPVEFLGTWLKSPEKVSELKINLDIEHSLSREPVVVYSKGALALILARKTKGIEEYRYIPLKEFGQTREGDYYLQVGDQKSDPFEYFELENFDEAGWYTERQLLALAHNHKYPNAIVGIVRLLTLDRGISLNSDRQSERPDFVLLSNPGFNFNSSHHTEGDHGALEKVQVKNALFMTKLGDKSSLEFKDLDQPVLSKDILPTILKLNGMSEKSADWKPFWYTLLK